MQTFPTQRVGVTSDSGNIFASHIATVCHACYNHLKDLRCIHKFLSVETAELLANLMISYCDSLLYGLNKYNVIKLQNIQNAFPGSQFHTASCLNIISLHSRPLNSPNLLHTYHSESKRVVSLMEIGFFFTWFVLERPLIGKVLLLLPSLNGTDSHNWSDHSTQ